MNCKPGDLAIVIGARLTPEIIGAIVEVIGPACDGQIFRSINGLRVTLKTEGRMTWVVRSDRPLMWRMDSGRELYFSELPASDRMLRPVSGLPITDEVTEDLKEPA